MRRAGGIDGSHDFSLHDHVCWVHEGLQSWRDAAVSWLADGVDGHEQLLYTADRPTFELVADLAGLPGRNAMLDSGQLRVVPLSQAFGPLASYQPAGQLAYYRGEVLAAAEAGYGGLRVAADASPLAANPEHARRRTGQEVLMDAAAAGLSMAALCGYDEHRIGSQATAMLSAVHPLRHPGVRSVNWELHAEADGSWRLSGEMDWDSSDVIDVAFSVLSTLPTSEDLHLHVEGLAFVDVAGARALVVLATQLSPDRFLVLHDPPALLERIIQLGWGQVAGLQVRRS